MYLSFFNLKDKPFSNTFQRNFLYLNEYNRLLLRSLIEDLDRFNLHLVMGEAGSGKTTLIKRFLESMPSQIKCIKINYIAHDESDFIRFIALELGLSGKSSRTDVIKAINALSEQYVRVILVVDDADRLTAGALKMLIDSTEELRMQNCPFNLILVGLTALKTSLDEEGLLDGLEGYFRTYYVSGMHKADMEEYIRFRLAVAGSEERDLFDKAALESIFKYSKGLPRLINMICEASLLNAYLMNEKTVTEQTVQRAMKDLLLEEDFRIASLSIPVSPIEESAPPIVETEKEGAETSTSAEEEALKGVIEREIATKTYHSKEVLSSRVLVLDTSARMRMHYENYFTQKGISFRVFKEFNQLFSFLREETKPAIDILVLDSEYLFIKGGLESPEGMKALDILLKEFSFLPVIVTSTLPLSVIRNKLLQKGLAYFVCKPELKEIDLSEVRTRLSGFFRELDLFREFIERQFDSFYRRVLQNDRVK
ncbi:MAG: AAA family ATPase [Nitrospirae bacterium]|nr:MAG: AAA family ATPase [Nitrospirota bacterium]